MKRLHDQFSLETYLGDLIYTESVLNAYEVTRILCPSFTAHIRAGEEKMIQALHIAQQIMRAQAVFDVAHHILDNEIMRFSKVLLLYVDGNKENPDYKRFFVELPSKIIARSIREELEYIITIIIPELTKLDANHQLKPSLSLINTALNATQEAMALRLQKYAEQKTINNDIMQWKMDANNLRNTTYGQLLQIAMQNKHEKSWTELFFKKTTKKSTKDSNNVA